MQQQPAPLLVIEAGSHAGRYWHELWRFRELLVFLTWRDILVRYKQTVIGVMWSVLRPLVTMLVFTFVFGRVAKLPTEGEAPYALMVFAALLPWQLFANAVLESSNSLVANADMISKVYFPRMIMPISAIMTALVDFAIALGLFVLLMLVMGVMPALKILLLPVFLMMALAAALGGGLMIAALNVSFRDFRYVIPFFVQFGLYVSPVGFSSAAVPERWQLLYALNPMVGVIDGFRWCLLGKGVDFPMFESGLALGISVAMLVAGVLVFRRMERTFADKV
jgi:lipopolysaccharide transport system permease protein